MDILDLTALELSYKIKNHELTVQEAILAVLQRISDQEELLHCYVSVRPTEDLLTEAAALQERIDHGELSGPLAGVPIAVKDNICTKGILTTCSSKILEHFIPTYSAAVMDRITAAGLILIGKTNMDEFAMGSTTESSAFGITRNPRNPEHVPGGSSGGSCAAVAAGEAFLALGSDTGGSIRQPAAYCGVTGLKPTYGTVSRYGLIAYASSLDQIGPIGKTAADCAALYEIIKGHDDKDSTSATDTASVDEKSDFNRLTANLTVSDRLSGIRIGIPRDYMKDSIAAPVAEGIRRAVELLTGLGAIVEEFDLGLTEFAIPAYYVIASAEASSNLSRFDGVKYGYRTPSYDGLHDMYKKTRSEGFGAEVKRRIMLGSFVLSSGYYDAYYLKALKTKALIKKSFDNAFKSYDFILSPVAPTTAPKFGEYEDDPIRMYLSDIYTVSVNLCGLPAISLPCGRDSKGLPVGVQLISDCFADQKLLLTANAFEAAERTSAAL